MSEKHVSANQVLSIPFTLASGAYTVKYRVVRGHEDGGSTALYCTQPSGDDCTQPNKGDYAIRSDSSLGSTFDQNAKRGTMTVVAGTPSAKLPVWVAKDNEDEGMETVVLEITDKINGTHEIGTRRIIIQLHNNASSELAVDEAGTTLKERSGAEHKVSATLSRALPDDAHFEFCVEGTATLGTDYELVRPDGTKAGAGCHAASVPAGGTSVDLATVRVLDDSDHRIEPDEHVKIRLRRSTAAGRETGDVVTVAPSSRNSGETISTVVTIRDDDIPILAVSGQKQTGRSGGLIEFTVRAVNGPFADAVGFNWKAEDTNGVIDDGTKSVTIECTQYLRDHGVCTGDYQVQTPKHRRKTGWASLPAGRTAYEIDFLVRGDAGDGTATVTLSRASGSAPFELAPGRGSACVAVNGGRCAGGGTPVVRIPDTQVANVQVSVVDDASATVTWDAVPHAASYRVEWDGRAGDPPVSIGDGAEDGITGTTATIDHNASEAMTLTVTVTPEYVDGNGDTQRPAALAGTATLDVQPASVPEIAVSGGGGVTEGDPASFTVTADPAPAAPLTVTLTVGQSGDVAAAGATGSREVTVPTGGSVTLDIATDDDGTDEPDGSITATLAAGDGYTVAASPDDIASVAVADDDTAANAWAALIAKMYTWRNDPKWGVYKSHTDRWDRALLAFGESVADASLTPMTAAEAQAFADRGWTRWVEVAAALHEIESGGTATPDPVPVVTVSGGAGVTEGDPASFTVTANPAPTAPLTVTLTVGQSGDVAAAGATGSREVEIPIAGSVTLDIATVDDGADEPDGSVSVTVDAGDGYTVGSANAHTVSVADDDAGPAAVPELSLAAGSAVDEGGNAEFTINASPAPQAALTVQLSVAQSGDYLSAPQPASRTVTLAAGAARVTLTLATVEDGTDEADGSVSVTIDAGNGYTVAAGQDTGTVAVRDNDEPVVSIAAGAGVTEGDPASFTVTANPTPAAPLTVTLTVGQSGDYAATGQTGSREVTVPTGGSVTVEVATDDDSADEPDGSITATLAAGNGYTVAASPDDTATVEVSDNDEAGVPSLSVVDGEANENEGRLPVVIRLDPPSKGKVTVWAKTRESSPVSARAGVDYRVWNARWGIRIDFRPGETERRLAVGLVNDSHDEDAETFEVVLSDPSGGAAIADGTGVMTIVNSDPMPAAWLARFGRTVAEQALDGIAGRMAAPRTAGAHGTIAGQALSFGGPDAPAGAANDNAAPGSVGLTDSGSLAQSDIARAFGASGNGGFGHDAHGSGFGSGAGSMQSQGMTGLEALLGSSFTATGEKDGSGGSMAFWGRAAQLSFDGREGTFSLDGEATTAMLGADYARDRWLVGMALMQSSGEGGYQDSGTEQCPDMAGMDEAMQAYLCDGAVREGDGEVEATLAAAIPYAAIQASERLRLWGALGHGAGEVVLKPDLGGPLTSDISWTMASMGLRGELLAEGSGPALALTSDALWARTSSDKTGELAASDSDVTRLRLGLEGSWRTALEGGGSVTPKLEVGVRHDGGDAETGFGVELGGGIAWVDPALGLSLDLSGRTLIAHASDDLEDRGFAASLAFDPDPATQRGLSLTLAQDWGGSAQGGLDALFAPETLDRRSGGGEATSRWQAEAAYGFPAFGGRFTGSPHVGLGLATAARDYSLGWRFTPAGRAPDLSFGLKATRRESDGAEPEHILGVEASGRW